MQKLKVWLMESRLTQFAEQGLTGFAPAKDMLMVLRHSSNKEIEQAAFTTSAGLCV